MNRILHLVCLRAPWPDDTGGARDMFDRLKMLHQNGIRIHLHYFTAKDTPTTLEVLSPYCVSIHSYPKKLTWGKLLNGLPYILACRTSTALRNWLSADSHPILFDGIHTTESLSALAKPGRKMVVRMHNNEVFYYRELARTKKNLWKRIYFLWESIQLHRWIKKLPAGLSLGCIQEHEKNRLQTLYPNLSTFLLPPVIPQSVVSQVGSGGYCLYHGDLSVATNERSAIWLLKRVFAKLKLPLVIAGKSPSPKLEKLVHFYQHACLVANPSRRELIDLIGKAQINVLPASTRSGIKLKIFDALQYGRHCVINQEMRASAPWTDSCVVVSNDEEMVEQLRKLYVTPFTKEQFEARRTRLLFWGEQLNPLTELLKRLW